MSKEVQRWADSAMYKAEDQPEDGPKVYLLNCNNDPLGSIAAAAKAYKGEFVKNLAEITDEERRYYLEQTQKSVLAMPLESVNFHFRITGVTRGFTHQMVRQRTAAYSQESTRFAVKETVPVGRPPSLDGTIPWKDFWKQCAKEIYPLQQSFVKSALFTYQIGEIDDYAANQATPKQLWRKMWDETVDAITDSYNNLVNSGMPAEDARGLLPTNLLTQLNYFTNLRNYKEEAGKRLCTQAQFEWRLVFAEMVKAIREYGMGQMYSVWEEDGSGGERQFDRSSAWQFDALADLFRPICYYRGKCQFEADYDRYCSIRERVNENAQWNIPSTQWEKGTQEYTVTNEQDEIKPIFPAEWLLDPTAARKKA